MSLRVGRQVQEVLRFELNDRGQLRARHDRQLGLPVRASKPVNPMKLNGDRHSPRLKSSPTKAADTFALSRADRNHPGMPSSP